MPVNGVRVLPDIPKNMPNMEILIREFETGSCSMSTSHWDTTSKSSTLNGGSFVKKIVEVYESSVRASNENSQLGRAKGKFGVFNTLDVVQNRKNIEKNSSNLAMHNEPNSQCQNSLKKISKISTLFEARDVEDDFVTLNRYHSESDEKTVLETWPESSPKINMYGTMDELLTNVRSSSSKRNESWNLKKRDQRSKDKTKKNKSMICSSPLEDVEGKDLDCEDPLDNILTSSCDSSSNSSYRNLQADLYDFEDEQWQLEFSSASLSSLKSSSESSHNDILSINSSDGSLLLDSSFQDITVTLSKDVLKTRENLEDIESISRPSSNFDHKSPRVIGALLNEDRPIKIDNDTRVTWISALGEKLSRKKSLKKLLQSAFNTKLLLNYKKVWKKSAEKQPSERTSDSGFIELFPSSSSSSLQKSWRSDPGYIDEKPLTPPTFGTFGRVNNACDNGRAWSKKPRIVLTEMSHEKFASDSEPSYSTTWVPLRHTTSSCKENRRDVKSLSKNTIIASSKLKVSCPPLSKHPYLTRNGIPKHTFVAKTELDQTAEEMMEEEMRWDTTKHERKSDAYEFPGMRSVSVSQAELNTSYPKMSECLTSSPNNNYDLSRSRSCKSTSALDELVHRHTSVYDVPTLCNVSMDFSSTIHNNRYVQKVPCTSRYATVSPKNLRFSMSQEKSRAIEGSFDA